MIDRSTLAALAGLTLAALPGSALAATPNDATGTYLTEDGRARIRVEKCGPQNTNLCGYVVWLKVPLNDKGQPRVDFKNPDTKKQARPSLGHQLIMGLKPDADARYAGKIYNADEGKFYDVTMWADQPTELSVRGCMLGFLCGSQTWSKVNDVVPGQLTAATNQPGGPRSDAEWAPKAAAPKPGAKPAAAPGAAPAAPAAE
ncbi:MAG: DUF2147 domain-containing protein [Methylobacterium sp.]|uniref:DUF2147 domain-containing protein n=1 Tax=unclassified Methylobacterium TaxID=2615210 RepID=UPI0007010AE9|nr:MULTISPECIES: DUF2147 domain-containing protein [unclassified Methylobacterium]KQP08765.1 hypothetical protein ASF28_20645 [Methylobacterium sp. Leaf99]MDO9425804.1 DUF2147 domain-containing protein [Methylobacterium sp.]TXM69897.1 DUF2147 domain-containing protein [Methylobacterium sp. WL69]